MKNLKVEYRPLDGLIPYANNARTHSDEQIAEIAASIAKPTQESCLPVKNSRSEYQDEKQETQAPLRFSLAGVQLKFSALMGRHGGLTIPASGMGGDWIVKLPSPTHDKPSEKPELFQTSLAIPTSMAASNVPDLMRMAKRLRCDMLG